ncbi:RND family efflux transporter, MFP subunit [Palleronia salina]|uniref:RND family efflux transporter, MFP subunit n=1 Tax=Palleronia salina TaxID=313368 RepID=A0A1M6KNB6_9RHOB|nr:efflux RND transporter periplasmic adaptor subunit [Palleronia salina]SHJ60488.1 RND family efflux transporter, MFP subunit [Palleronia salina]
MESQRSGLIPWIVFFVVSSGGSAWAQTAEDCLLEPSAELRLAVRTPGVVASVHAARGDAVGAGDVLLTQVDEVERARLNVARGRAEDRATLDGIVARLDVARAQRDRISALAEGDLVTQERLDAAEQDVLSLLQERAAAESTLRSAALEAEAARAALDQLVLRAPQAGVVTERGLDPGEFADQQSPAFTVVTLDPLHVQAWIPARYWGGVARGDVAQLSVPARGDGRLEADVIAVDPILETVSETFRVTLALPNPDSRLPAGLPCTLYLPIGG